MIKKYNKQIGLAVFITIIVLTFLIMVINSTHPTKSKQETESTVNKTVSETTIGVETTSHQGESYTAETTGLSAASRKKYKNKLPYKIKVNRAENFVTVYTFDNNGKYTVPFKTFWCSTGKDPEDTPLGAFHIYERYDWRIMVDGTYAQYAIRIYGPIMLHSVPYISDSHDSLEYWEYNKLGKPASLGCVRLRAKDIKWLYDNCKDGTTVVIYSKKNQKPPIPLRPLKRIKKSDKYKDWDPSDPVKSNPWKKKGVTTKSNATATVDIDDTSVETSTSGSKKNVNLSGSNTRKQKRIKRNRHNWKNGSKTNKSNRKNNNNNIPKAKKPETIITGNNYNTKKIH